MKTKHWLLIGLMCVMWHVASAQKVHYTRTGKKYHSSGCRYLSGSDYVCTLEQAQKKGLSACSKCNPPTQVQVQSSTQKRKTQRGNSTRFMPLLPKPFAANAAFKRNTY